jgi:hypothetical protein
MSSLSLSKQTSSSSQSSSSQSSSSLLSVSVVSNDTNTTSFTNLINSTSVVVGNDQISRYPVPATATAITDDGINSTKVENISESNTILMEAHELSNLIISIANNSMTIDSKPLAIHIFPNHYKAVTLVMSYFMENCANVEDAGNL